MKVEVATQPFPFLDLKAQAALIRDEVSAAIERVLASQMFILGKEVENFEHQIASYIGVKHAIGCASGTDALMIALMAAGVGQGDEVITVPFTFVATAGPVALLGAKPVFVDVDQVTFNIDPAQIEKAITPRTKAIIPVDLFGLMAPLDEINALASKKNIAVIEDAAQAIGASRQGKNAGSATALGCFSFFPSKNLGAAGDGGLVTTNDDDLNSRLRMIRGHGSPRRYEYDIIGTNSRLDALQAAVLGVKLKYLDQWAEARRHNAALYTSLLNEAKLGEQVITPTEPKDHHHIYNQYTIRAQRRDELKQFLAGKGIPSEIYYPYPLHLQKAFTYLGYKEGAFPNSEQACREVLSLPIYPELGDDRIRAVVQGIREFYKP